MSPIEVSKVAAFVCVEDNTSAEKGEAMENTKIDACGETESADYCTVSMDTARKKIREVCEEDVNATITMVISRAVGEESLKIIVTGTTTGEQ